MHQFLETLGQSCFDSITGERKPAYIQELID
jgi:hypothetical protein